MTDRIRVFDRIVGYLLLAVIAWSIFWLASDIRGIQDALHDLTLQSERTADSAEGIEAYLAGG